MVYLPGFKALNEEPAIAAIDVITTDDVQVGVEDEWGIEVKRLQFVGDNGKSNGYTTTKVLSPYLNDRGMLHDALRLREYGFTRRIAIVGYCFEYDEASWLEASLQHPDSGSTEVLTEVSKAMERNGGQLSVRPLIDFADSILRMRGLTTGPSAEAPFKAPRHPAGGRGLVFGWEIRRPTLEPHYDPRHPW